MMKTPEEIKRGLECCSSTANCDDGCPYFVTVEGSFGCDEMGCEDGLLPDALDLIRQLEATIDESYAIMTQIQQVVIDSKSKLRDIMAMVPRWISVEERLPEKWVHVLACTSEGYRETMTYDGHRWWQRDVIVNVTHWMPLPKPPEEGGTDEA